MTFRQALLAAALLLCTALPAWSQSYGTILLRNVSLLGEDGAAPRVVNVLLRDGKLDVMTEDLIPLEDADVTFDAAEGFILGKLELGEPASFLILGGNPQLFPELLLDTKQYATFAIIQGEVKKNPFEVIREETPEERKRVEQGWLAYTPPPLAVPLDYQDTSRWNRWDSKYISGIAAAALILDRQRWVEQDAANRQLVGDLGDFEGGEIRGLRFGGVGTLNFRKPWVWTAFAATHAFDKGFDQDETDDLTIFDLRLDIPVWEQGSFSIGKQKEPISMERVMSLAHWPIQERSAVADALLPSRNTGLVMSGNLFDRRVSLAGGIFNDWLDKDQPSSLSDNATQFVGRATWVPWMSDNESTLIHLGLGLRHSNGKEGGRIVTEPEFNQSPAYIESDFFETDNYDTVQAEASLRSGPFWLHGEYIRGESDTPQFGKLQPEGYHVTASWITTGEVRAYNRRAGIFGKVPISRSVDQNGWGAFEVATRYSHFDASDAPGVDGGDAGLVDIWSLGFNWWLNYYLQLGMNYRYINLEKDGLEGNSQGLNARILLVLE